MQGNYTICNTATTNTATISTNNSFQFHQRPSCCPCCPWFLMTLCHQYKSNSNSCTTLILYYKFNISDNHLKFYFTFHNIRLLLPCKMRLSNWKEDIKITNDINTKDDTLIEYKNGNLIHQQLNFQYYPSVGLCINTTFLDDYSMIECRYQFDNTIQTFAIEKQTFYDNKLINKFILSNGLEILPATKYLNIEQNDNFTIFCRSQLKKRNFKDFIICLELTTQDKSNKSNFKCSNIINLQKLTINSKDLKNATKITCESIDESRYLQESIELILMTNSNQSSLSLINSQSTNKRYYLKIYENSTSYHFPIYYNLISNYHLIKCQFIGPIISDYNVTCNVQFVGLCSCLINLNSSTSINDFTNHTISVQIYNNNQDSITANISLLPIYLKTPNIIGLTSEWESTKIIKCNTSLSTPYQVMWILELDNETILNKTTKSLVIQFPIHKNISIICVRCQVENELGLRKSAKKCEKLLDFNMSSLKVLQIFLENATIWHQGFVTSSVLEFTKLINNNKQIIDIMDLNGLIIKCVSKLHSGVIEIGFNDEKLSRRTSEEVVTKYTKQSTMEIGVEELKNTNYSGVFYCKQSLDNGTILIDKSVYINIIRTSIPKFKSKSVSKYQYLPGHTIHLIVTIDSYPEPHLILYKQNDDNWREINFNANKILSLTKKSQTRYEFTIQFLNASRNDSGDYLLLATNIRGNDSVIIILETFLVGTGTLSNKSIVIISIIIVTMVIVGGILLKLFRKSGYSVPIIQVHNQLYKSINTDSLQLIVKIWPDADDRAKWLIDADNEIKLIKKIGGGNYGHIYLGSSSMNWKNPELVALKEPIVSKPIDDQHPDSPHQFCQVGLDCFVNEVKILSKLTNCNNIIHMYGCTIQSIQMDDQNCSLEPHQTTLLVLEYCYHRSLNEYLKNNSAYFSLFTKTRKLALNGFSGMKIDEGLTLLDLKKIALGIATGLEHLSSLSIIHRDLATRNILICANKIPKISDFGLAIELGKQSNANATSYQIFTLNKALPYKILPPEALEKKLFYVESDIWSFSLLLWEMFNLANCTLFPYLKNPNELLKFIQSRLLLEEDGENCDLLNIPKYADESIWNLIKSCWFMDPFKRPTAQQLKDKLIEIIRESPVEIIRVSGVNSDNEFRTRLSSSSSTVITSTSPNNNNNNNNNISNINQYLATVSKQPGSNGTSEIELSQLYE